MQKSSQHAHCKTGRQLISMHEYETQRRLAQAVTLTSTTLSQLHRLYSVKRDDDCEW